MSSLALRRIWSLSSCSALATLVACGADSESGGRDGSPGDDGAGTGGGGAGTAGTVGGSGSGQGGSGGITTGGTGGGAATAGGGTGGGDTHSQIAEACSRLCQTATMKCPDFTTGNCMQQCVGWVPQDFACGEEYLVWVTCEARRPAEHYRCDVGNLAPSASPTDFCAAEKALYQACGALQ